MRKAKTQFSLFHDTQLFTLKPYRHNALKPCTFPFSTTVYMYVAHRPHSIRAAQRMQRAVSPSSIRNENEPCTLSQYSFKSGIRLVGSQDINIKSVVLLSTAGPAITTLHHTGHTGPCETGLSWHVALSSDAGRAASVVRTWFV